MISLFSFILVLGIVVDDAIVVGESIFSRRQAGVYGVQASIQGARRVTVPVIFGVLTTVVAFAPMLFVPGYMGKIWRVIPLIIIPTLMFPLVESKLVLPSHLSHSRPEPKSRGRRNILVRAWNGFFDFFVNGLEWVIARIYRPLLGAALEWRYLTVAVAVATLLLTVGLAGSGYVDFVFFPEVESDFISASVTMPLETPVELTEEAVRVLEQSGLRLQREIEEELGSGVIRHVLTSVGDQPFATIAQRNAGNWEISLGAPHLGEVAIDLLSPFSFL